MDTLRFIADNFSGMYNFMLEMQFDDKLEELQSSMGQLKNRRDTLMRSAGANVGHCTHRIDEWFRTFDDLERAVTVDVEEGSRLLDRYCLGAWCPFSFWSARNLRNRVMSKLPRIEKHMNEGNFEVLLESGRGLIRVRVKALPESHSLVGLESTLNTAWGALQEDGIGIIALYGMGAVGKTTVLRNINNKFLTTPLEFDVVIWVVVSKDLNIDRVQRCIGERLGLSWSDANVDMRTRACDIFNVLRTKKFVLLLDDIWAPLDLSIIGIPDPNSEIQSKVLFTTRSETVCGWMITKRKIKVECLNWDDAWALFKSTMGIYSVSSEIEVLAKMVVKECGGLPKALIITGCTMASKSTRGEWKRAVKTLQEKAAEFPGMRKEVFAVLKSSYDSLIDEAHKQCFLFCSFYPENYEIDIESLARQCIGLGCIKEFDEWEDAVDACREIIAVLECSCLLESSTNQDGSKVKMHNVFRGLAHWIANETDKDKILVNTGRAVFEAAPARKWKTPWGISLTGTQITELNDIPDCPHLLILLLADNAYLQHIHEKFFSCMPALRFLDLSRSLIKNLPSSISELVQLEYLDVSHTNLAALPGEMKRLIKLKYLFLFDVPEPCKISVGVIRHLFNLEVLQLDVRSFGDGEADLLRGVEELGYLEKLISLEIKISNVKVLEYFLKNHRAVRFTKSLFICEKYVESGREIIKLALSCFSTSYSACLTCGDSCLGHMRRLRELNISNCQEMEELVVNCLSIDVGLLQTLETMTLDKLPKLKYVHSGDICFRRAPSFIKLHHIKLSYCGSLLNLTWLLLVPTLRTLFVETCHGLKMIVSDESGACGRSIFSNLTTLTLINLQNLSSICPNALPFPSLELLKVSSCPELRELPLDSYSAGDNRLQSISGSHEWWNNLNWVNDTVKSRFTPFFKSGS